MLDHPVVDIALGLFWLYLVLSLTASAVQEWIAAVVGLRASNLRAGLRSLIGDDHARRLYEHPLVRNLGKRNPFFRSLVSKSKEDCYKRPSYIAPDTLSSVLLAVLAEDTGGKSLVAYGAGEVRAAVEEDPAGPSAQTGPGGTGRRLRGCGGPPLVAGVVRRIDVDALDLVVVGREQGLQRCQIVSVNDQIVVQARRLAGPLARHRTQRVERYGEVMIVDERLAFEL